MPTKAEASQEAALDALTSIAKDGAQKPEVRIEAAKIILNRPRFFVSGDATEA